MAYDVDRLRRLVCSDINYELVDSETRSLHWQLILVYLSAKSDL